MVWCLIKHSENFIFTYMESSNSSLGTAEYEGNWKLNLVTRVTKSRTLRWAGRGETRTTYRIFLSEVLWKGLLEIPLRGWMENMKRLLRCGPHSGRAMYQLLNGACVWVQNGLQVTMTKGRRTGLNNGFAFQNLRNYADNGWTNFCDQNRNFRQLVQEVWVGIAQSIQRLATGWTIGWSGFDFRGGGLGIFFFDTVSKPALGPTQPPI
jgi:hypothetical protein